LILASRDPAISRISWAAKTRLTVDCSIPFGPDVTWLRS
jgi:hypothetical protein